MTAIIRGRVRAMGVADCAAGVVLLTVPTSIAGLVADGAARPPTAVVRLLGARLIGQGAAQLLQPAKGTARLAAAIEGAHGASMVGLAVISPRYRRPAVIAAAVAAASLAMELGGT
jgi:hypothetical protein